MVVVVVVVVVAKLGIDASLGVEGGRLIGPPRQPAVHHGSEQKALGT